MNGKLDHVLTILQQGPASSLKIALEMDSNTNQASGLLHHLNRQGKVMKLRKMPSSGGLPGWIYSLAEHA